MNGFWLVFFIVLFTSSNPIHSEKKIKKEKYKAVEVHVSPVQDLYNQMNLSSILKFEAFDYSIILFLTEEILEIIMPLHFQIKITLIKVL